jgi:type II secretory pathway component PulJ
MNKAQEEFLKLVEGVLKNVLLFSCILLVCFVVYHSITIHQKTIEQLSQTAEIMRVLTEAQLEEARLRRADDQLYIQLLEILQRKRIDDN